MIFLAIQAAIQTLPLDAPPKRTWAVFVSSTGLSHHGVDTWGFQAWYQHRPQTVQENQLNQINTKTSWRHAEKTCAKSAPNLAQRAQHSQSSAQHSTARPPACPVSFFPKDLAKGVS